MRRFLLLFALIVLSIGAEAQLKAAAAPSTPGTHTAVLTWTESTPNVTSFKIYKATTSGAYNWAAPLAQVPGNQLTYTDTTFTQTSYYVVTAILGSESAPSNEAVGTFPQQPAAPSLQPISVQ